jgi:hypothetical protein
MQYKVKSKILYTTEWRRTGIRTYLLLHSHLDLGQTWFKFEPCPHRRARPQTGRRRPSAAAVPRPAAAVT